MFETLNFDITTIVFWYWWLAAVVFFILEMAVPAALFLWMGVSAIIVGFLSFSLSLIDKTLSIEIELLIFSVLSIIAVLGWRRYAIKNPKTDQASNLNQRGNHYIGRSLVLSKPIQNGFGREKVGSSYWTLQGPDSKAGTTVMIIGHEGTQLIVEPTK